VVVVSEIQLVQLKHQRYLSLKSHGNYWQLLPIYFAYCDTDSSKPSGW